MDSRWIPACVSGAIVAFGSLLAPLGIATVLLSGAPAYATETNTHAITDSKGCANVEGWYTNEDEGSDTPTQKLDGWLFEEHDLIHHATGPLDLADVKGGTFTAEGSADKVVFKMETIAPYSTIVQTPDGKFWSSKVPAGKGSQAQPVEHVIDLTDADVIEQPGKEYTGATKVVTFGVGYWTESGSTLVKSITFRGHVYKTGCEPQPSNSASHSTVSPSTSHSGTVSPSTSRSSSPVAGSATGGLPVTGPGVQAAFAIGAAVIATGAGLLLATRMRRRRFEA